MQGSTISHSIAIVHAFNNCLSYQEKFIDGFIGRNRSLSTPSGSSHTVQTTSIAIFSIQVWNFTTPTQLF